MPPSGEYRDWVVSAGPVDVDAAASREIAKILLEPKSYYRGAPKACVPTPGVKLKFIGAGERTVWVYLCFECEMLFVEEGKTSRGGDDFDPAARALAALMKKLFPKDPEIQLLR